MSEYMPGAVQLPQPGGVPLDTSLPPRWVWHITWDQLQVDGAQPDMHAVGDYLVSKEWCPHILWNPFTGEMIQYYPASVGSRALMYNDQDGAACVQIEVFFTPGCVVDGVTYHTVAETPLKGWNELLAWADSMDVPRVWPMGAPQWTGNSRDVATWNGNAGHYGHCNSPGDSHTDPGPMPDLGGSINLASTGTTPAKEEDDKMLFLMRGPKDTGVWIGDGVVRRAIPNEATLKDILYRYQIGEIKLANNGQVIVGNVDLCGKAV